MPAGRGGNGSWLLGLLAGDAPDEPSETALGQPFAQVHPGEGFQEEGEL